MNIWTYNEDEYKDIQFPTQANSDKSLWGTTKAPTQNKTQYGKDNAHETRPANNTQQLHNRHLLQWILIIIYF
jgi:hypothetical protein